MDRYRLKNIIILILLLVNLFLLGSLAQRRSVEQATYRNTVEQMASLFFADGIELNTSGIPKKLPPAAQTLTRSTELDRKAADFLLGGTLDRADQGGGIFTYTGNNGSALFRANGSFDAVGLLAEKDAVSFCKKFCKTFGYDEPTFQLDESGTGTATAVRLWARAPIYNCTVTFTLEEHALMSVSGTLLPELSTELPQQEEMLSPLAALTAFQQVRKETGAVVTAVSAVTLCYELQSTTAVPLSLTPAWRIKTNTANYYVNCITGAVSLD